ncbi:PA2169 family four-helix-bundle protein [Hymenobacter nivis]|uniref:PA2169 family four-helix-bundle protein n=1 Tax=Hymenobacter nivis TaxID=1850093 RepID=A0A502GXD1_9BACT|nr:PA2169 family four-helix-bundle protein [Hymenobacter nivis]TPG66554.1 PA2169 family four-helix-bundle protein [Hymenobacter nivis]
MENPLNSKPVDKAVDKAQDVLDQTKDAIADSSAADLLNKVPASIKDASDKVVTVAKDASDKVVTAAKDARDKAVTTAKEASDKAVASAKEASDKVVEGFNSLSTTQKIVGGALVALGLTYLVAPKKKGKDKRKAAALDQLLLFVNDRIEGYKRAVAETTNADLRGYYELLVAQSQQFASTLNGYLKKVGGERETGTTLKGKLYRKLMDAQAFVTGHDEKAILAANVFGERWAIRAYKKALRRKALKGEMRTAVQKQFAQSKKTYKHLKQLTKQQR